MVKCPRCQGTETEQHEHRVVCTTCALVIEENAIVSELTWHEDAAGVSSVNGVFINASGVKSYRRGGPGGLSKEPREVTLENGRKKIAQVAAALKMSSHYVEAAQRLFALAVTHHFIQGRRTNNVVAACLYTICRRERSPHMLLDFSDILQTNVFVLGHTFLRFCQTLQFAVPVVDPSLYIPRFCQKLEFEEKTQQVANTALRLVQRMKRDWIQTGRRPAGICGAALLIASRLHGFKRTQKEILSIVRVCDVTLRKRLLEFQDTPTSGLTKEEFEVVDLDEERDPPAFARNRAAESTAAATASVPASPAPSAAAAEEDLAQELQAHLAAPDTLRAEQEVSRALADPLLAKALAQPVDSNDFSDIPDEEIDLYIHNKDEVETKTKLWESMNKDFLEAQEQKRKDEEANTAAGKPPPRNKRKKKEPPANTGGGVHEALATVLKRKTGNRVNEQSLSSLFSAVNESAQLSRGATGSAAAFAPLLSRAGVSAGGAAAASQSTAEGSLPARGSPPPASSGRQIRIADEPEEDPAEPPFSSHSMGQAASDYYADDYDDE